MSTVTGDCLCGAIQFEVSLPSLWCAHCHCSQCQRYHGAPLVTWVGFPDKVFKLTRGDDELRWYQSSALAQRGFCGSCGSSFLFRSQQWPDEIHISLTNFHAGIDRAPQVHVYYDTHVPWLQLGDELPRKA